MATRFKLLNLMLMALILLVACAPAGAAKPDNQPTAPVAPATELMPASAVTKMPDPTATQTPSATEIVQEHVVWRFQTEGSIWGSPLPAGDTVYVGSDDGKLYAVSAASGQQKWAFATGGLVRSQPAIDTTQAGSVLYFSCDDGYLYALNAEAGKQLWRADIGNTTELSVRTNLGSSGSPLGYDYVQSSPVLADGRIYIGSADGKVYAVSADKGDVLWTYQTGAQIRATPTLAEGVLYVGSWDSSMYALDAQTGALRWQTPIGGQVQTTALVSGNLIYSASRKASVVALDTATGQLQWEYSYGANMWVESSPTLVDSTLYIGSSGTQMIFGFDAKTGKKQMNYLSHAFCWSRPLVVDQTLVIGCTNVQSKHQGLFALAIGPNVLKDIPLKLTPSWQLPMAGSLESSGDWSGVASSPILAGSLIYFGGLDGALYAVRK
jgi:eukaryotic-like serine/threonine-protein kinase